MSYFRLFGKISNYIFENLKKIKSSSELILRELGHVSGDRGKGWGHVAGYGGMWQGVGAVVGVDVCGRGSGLWHRQGHVAGWGHVVGCEDMW